jgi:hypothetical protein
MEQYIPSTMILFWSALLSCARFENQRWVRARATGLRGSSETFGAFVDLTSLVGLAIVVAVIAMHWFDFGWEKTLGLVGLTMAVGWLWAMLGAFVAAMVTPLVLWIIGTALVYVAAVPLLFQFTWFGLR